MYNQKPSPDNRNIAYIHEFVSQKAIMLQLAEECTEVAQQAIKIVRIRDGENPTPITQNEAIKNLHDELGDFFACLACLIGVDNEMISKVKSQRLNRWRERLEAAHGKEKEG